MARALRAAHARKEGAALFAELTLHSEAVPVGVHVDEQSLPQLSGSSSAQEAARAALHTWQTVRSNACKVLGAELVSVLMRLRVLASSIMVKAAQRALRSTATSAASSAEQGFLAALRIDNGGGQAVHQQAHSSVHTCSLASILVGPGFAEEHSAARAPAQDVSNAEATPSDPCAVQSAQAAAQQWLAADVLTLRAKWRHGAMTDEQLRSYVSALCDASSQLRFQLQKFYIRRLVDANLASIKAWLWRPQGPIMQRRMAQHTAKRCRPAEGCIVPLVKPDRDCDSKHAVM